MTPTIEFYDVFGASAAYLPQENMYKLMDQKGRLMVLCPDGTIPIARLAATRLAHADLFDIIFRTQTIHQRFEITNVTEL